MKIKISQILNAATMIFPFLAWKKHRKLSNNRVHKIMRIHIPISILYHIKEAFLNKNTILLNLLKHLDIFFIHLSAISGSIDVIHNFFPRRKIFNNLIYLTSIFHIHSFIYNIKKDNGIYRSWVLIINSLPIIICKKYNVKKIIVHATLACGLYYFDDILIIGHSGFHIVLYNIYDDYFNIFTRVKSYQKLIL